MSLRAAFLASLAALGACGNHGTMPDEERIVEVVVTSGRPQPAASEQAVRARQPVLIRAVGLGPPRLAVIAPDGKAVAAPSAPLLRDGHVQGTEVRFTPDGAGVYRVDVADAPGVTLLRLDAR